MRASSIQNNTFWFLKGGGEMGKLIQNHPWEKTQLQDPAGWSDILKNTLSLALNSKIPTALFWGPDHVCFYNDAYLPVLDSHGKHPGAMGKPGAEVWSERWLEVKPLIASVVSGGQSVWHNDGPFPLNREILSDDDFPRCCYTPVFGTDGIPSGVLVTCIGITAGRRSFSASENYGEQYVTEQEKTLKKAGAEEAKARLAIESAELGTYEINLLTGETKTSERFNAIWGVENGFSREQFTSLIHADDRASAETAYLASIKGGHLHYECRVVCNGKDQRWVRVKGTVLYDVDHKATALIGVAQDITEQKNFANELHKLVDERTSELQMLNEELAATNEELSETNIQLTRANKDLEEFAYVASHDLQEPLRKIQTFANIISERFADELSDTAAEYLRKVTASARRMSSLIKDLLDYSRLTFNNSLFQSLDLNTIVKDVISDFEVLITQKGAVIHMGELPVIEAIPIQVNQLFYNLIGNAIKFSRKGVKPEISIISRPLDDNGVRQYPNLKIGKSYYEITVLDNGIGFSQQYAEQIFAIFQRLNDRALYGGYGIGLALCRKIVDNHNGLVFASGRENEGAAFTVILPEFHT